MSGYKEFEGKTLDDAIYDACNFYDAVREKLEIEILNDSKGGIFGLVGARKARIRARLVLLSNVLDGLDGPAGKDKEKCQKKPVPEEPRQPSRKQAAPEESPRRERCPGRKKPVAPTAETAVAAEADGQEQVAKGEAVRPNPRDRQDGRQRRSRPQDARPQENGDRQPGDEFPDTVDADMDGDDLRRLPLEQLDAAELEAITLEVMRTMTAPLLGTCTLGFSLAGDRVRVSVTDLEDPGLLIGRDGQTLAALQYLVTRMVSNRMKALLRVQIDAGDYRERQDERLRELALSLAEKVKAGGRPQVTRPLSSYHRRVIHLTLQDDPQVQTHSKGEGEMKRVMVTRRKDRQ